MCSVVCLLHLPLWLQCASAGGSRTDPCAPGAGICTCLERARRRSRTPQLHHTFAFLSLTCTAAIYRTWIFLHTCTAASSIAHTQAAVGHHNVCVAVALLSAFLAPVLDVYRLVCFHDIGDLQLWVHLERRERVLHHSVLLYFCFGLSAHSATSWQYCRMPSLVPMQLLVPEGSDSHLPLCTLMCMLSFPQNIATWGSVSKLTESSAGTWKNREIEGTVKTR